MDYYDWVQKFKPLKNHLEDYASVDGYLFQPYGAQWAFVKSHNLEQIWTLIITDLDDDSTSWEIVNGIHIVNREGYLVTEKPCTKDNVVVY